MNERARVRAGTVGAIVAAICCATPILAVLLPLAGQGAWLAPSGPVVILLLFACLGLVAFGFNRRRATASAQCPSTLPKQGPMP